MFSVVCLLLLKYGWLDGWILSQAFTRFSLLSCHELIFKARDPQVLFDHMGCMKRYDSVQDILREFFELRLHYYKLRKDWLVGSLGAEAAKLSNQARFVLEKIEGKISIGKNAEIPILTQQ